MQKIYLDNNATTLVDPVIIKELHPLLSEPLNPSAIHFYGRKAKSYLQEARKSIASYLGAKSSEIIFTSGATEALNLMIHSLASLKKEGVIISSTIEHSAIYEPLLALQKQGVPVHLISPSFKGDIPIEEVEKALDGPVKGIILSAANGETGVKNDIEAIAKLAGAKNIPLIIDGVALVGKESFCLPKEVSGFALSGHKFHAPKGIGVAMIRGALKASPLFLGGPQEFKLRAGTENLEGAYGLFKAVEILQKKLPSLSEKLSSLRDYLEQSLLKGLPGTHVNGSNPRTPNVSNLYFEDVDGESLLILLDQCGVAASHGSACSSGAIEPSRVLRNMGMDRKRAAGSIRFSLSRFTTKEEIDRAIDLIKESVHKIRNA